MTTPQDATEALRAALRVATHSPHDQDGEPIEGFPVCSVCGAIQTEPSVSVEATWEAFDAEWTALVQAGGPDLGLDLMNVMGRHRPLIEAALRAESVPTGLDVVLLARLIKQVTYGGGETLGNAAQDAQEIAEMYAEASRA
jgi:hypothetical protein